MLFAIQITLGSSAIFNASASKMRGENKSRVIPEKLDGASNEWGEGYSDECV